MFVCFKRVGEFSPSMLLLRIQKEDEKLHFYCVSEILQTMVHSTAPLLNLKN